MTTTPLRPVEPVTTVLRQADHWARAVAEPGSPEYLDYLAAAIRSRVTEPMIAAQPVEHAQLIDDNAKLADEVARLQHALQRQTLAAEEANDPKSWCAVWQPGNGPSQQWDHDDFGHMPETDGVMTIMRLPSDQTIGNR